MKLRKGKNVYKFPPRGSFISGCVEGNQKHNQMCAYALQHVSIRLIPRDKATGMPTLVAFWPDKVEFYPVPDKAYKVRIIYTPPIQVW